MSAEKMCVGVIDELTKYSLTLASEKSENGMFNPRGYHLFLLLRMGRGKTPTTRIRGEFNTTNLNFIRRGRRVAAEVTRRYV